MDGYIAVFRTTFLLHSSAHDLNFVYLSPMCLHCPIGFNAAVAGCFFAVESVLWPSTADPFLSLSNSTSMVILSSVIASIVSEVGLGSDPAFTVPEYDFRSPSGTFHSYFFQLESKMLFVEDIEVFSVSFSQVLKRCINLLINFKSGLFNFNFSITMFILRI